MAEASVANPDNTRYFCHVCNEDVNPILPEFTCPVCRDGFIETRSMDSSMEVEDGDDELPTGLDESGFNALAQILNLGRPLTGALGRASPEVPRPRTHRYGTRSATASRAAAVESQVDQHGILGEILDALFATFRVNVSTTGQGPVQFRLHGNPGEYAWGVTTRDYAELDRVITHLLNQLNASGPPPLPAELIRKLPRVPVTQHNVDSSLQCMVCFEDYTLNEMVRQLPCHHIYHSECIVPWLELHGTCPVCRSSADPSCAADAAAAD